MKIQTDYNGRKTSLVYLERDGKYLILHRTKKEHDENGDKWIGVDFPALRSPNTAMCVRLPLGVSFIPDIVHVPRFSARGGVFPRRD